jgi:hypothetical protein
MRSACGSSSIALSSSKRSGLLLGCLAVDQVRPKAAAGQIAPIDVLRWLAVIEGTVDRLLD